MSLVGREGIRKGSKMMAEGCPQFGCWTHARTCTAVGELPERVAGVDVDVEVEVEVEVEMAFVAFGVSPLFSASLRFRAARRDSPGIDGVATAGTTMLASSSSDKRLTTGA